MKQFTHITAALSALLSLTTADWQYRSRSDLAPPRLNIAIPATKDVEPGFLFIAPFADLPDTPSEQHGPRQAGPYIFKDNGDLVWSGYGIYSIWSTNFQAERWKGKDVLFSFEGDHNAGYGHGHGHVTILDQHYETIRELRAGNHKLVDKHEFEIVNEETGLIQVYQPVPRDLTKWGAGPDQQWIVNAIIQELDIATGRLLFEWSSLEHVQPDESVLPITPGQAGSGYNSSDAWDYFHINSVDKDDDGNYLISARDACAIHKVNGTDGEIIWRLNGKKSDFEMKNGTKFCFQHHARWLEQRDGIEVISLYDNSAHGTEHNDGSEVHTAPTSSGKILRLDTKSWTAELVAAYFPPDDLLSKSQGSRRHSIFHAYVDSGYLDLGAENYRAFRYNWTGIPNEVPAIVALEGDEGTTIYVSWNGDTETVAWRFYAGTDEFGSRAFLGEVKRTSFETSLLVTDRVITSASAEAADARGRVLALATDVLVEADIVPFHREEERTFEAWWQGSAVQKIIGKQSA